VTGGVTINYPTAVLQQPEKLKVYSPTDGITIIFNIHIRQNGLERVHFCYLVDIFDVKIRILLVILLLWLRLLWVRYPSSALNC